MRARGSRQWASPAEVSQIPPFIFACAFLFTAALRNALAPKEVATKIQQIAWELHRPRVARASLEKEEAEGDEEQKGLSRVAKCRLSPECLEHLVECFNSEALAGQNLEALRTASRSPPDIPSAELREGVLDVVEPRFPRCYHSRSMRSSWLSTESMPNG